jgi:putative inorganic carbon (HCO3(-)) transporter
VTSSGELVARVTAGFGSPNQLAGFLVASLPLALAGLAIHRRAWALYAPAAALAAFGVYVSFSRGALIGMALVPFVFLRGRQLLAAVPLLAALVLALTPSLLEERFETLTSGGGEIATRVDIWDTSVAIWQAEPVTGAGLGSFPEAYAQARVPGKQFLPHTQFEPPPHAHNVFLQILAEVGIVGLAAFLALLAGALPLAARLRRHGEAWIRWTGAGVLASLVAFLAHNIFDVTLFQPETSVIFWVTLGLLSALAAVGTDRASSRAH